MTYLAVALAGALGALARVGIAAAVPSERFPWGTFAINVAGSFLLGLLSVALVLRVPPTYRLAATAGFLGAFTTFSTFSLEAFALLREGRTAAGLGYLCASVITGVAAAGAGVVLGERFGEVR